MNPIPNTEIPRMLAWLDLVVAEEPANELELLWLVGHGTKGARAAATKKYEEYRKSLSNRLGDSRSVLPSPQAFERFFMSFDDACVWALADRLVFLGVDHSGDNNVSISIGTTPA